MLKKIIAGVALVAIIATGTFFIIKNIDKKPEPQETEAEQTEPEETDESIDDTEAEETKESDDVERLTVDDVLENFECSSVEELFSGTPQSEINSFMNDWLTDQEIGYPDSVSGKCQYDGYYLPAISFPLFIDELNTGSYQRIAILPDKDDSFIVETSMTIPDGSGNLFEFSYETNEIPTYDESIERIIEEYNNQ